LLGFFKYYNFFIDNVNQLLLSAGIETSPVPYLNIILPIGLSFHTFQAMSYTLEVYRGNYPAERHLGIYSVYVLFYPQLVAGPIERPQNILPQLHEQKHFISSEVIAGVKQMMWGLFKKAVVADQLAIYVNSVYNHWEVHSGLTLVVATYAFAFQIYGDFSGYSDIAQGSARVMGFRLMDNFHLPYFSKSVTEFWRRWHMSLSSWLKDYLYISLGGNRKGKSRTTVNLFTTMVLGGLWHGASWNFVFWGFLNGLYLSLEKMFSVVTGTTWVKRLIQVMVTFHLICITWVFFRATTFEQAFGILKKVIMPGFWNLRIQDTGVFANMLLALGVMLFIEHRYLRNQSPKVFFDHTSVKQSLAWLLGCTLALLLWGVSTGSQFIYFQF
jgi:D-alanyl-lipoteichoic acid acyltransferase DltB (MBOAT superfamily)